jgi:hypothetical protein
MARHWVWLLNIEVTKLNSVDKIEIENIGEAIREGRALRPATAYRIRFAQQTLDFRDIEVNDPVPLGRQILEAAKLSKSSDYSLFAILESGDFEDVRLDEPFDLRGRGAERFIAFLTDREFKLLVNDSHVVWGTPTISGADLYALANPKENEAVFLTIRGEEDRQIESEDAIDLTVPGVEHFVTAPKRQKTVEIVVNGREVEVDNKIVTFDQLVAIAYPGEAPAPNIVYSITFRGAASKPHSGELAAGGFVEVKKGSIFNVVRTIQS